MNNGANNNLKIEPVTTNATTTTTTPPTTNVTITPTQPSVAPAPQVQTMQPVQQIPVAQPTVTPVQVTQTQPTETTPVSQSVAQNNVVSSLGSNVKIAPAQPFYNANGTINETPKKEEKKVEPKIVETPTPSKEEPPQIQMTVKEPPKKKLSFTPVFLILIIALIGVVVYQYMDNQSTITQMNYECTPVSTNGEEKELSLDSTIVTDLYNKVKTNIKEDIADINLDDQMKLYLAYRQIPKNKIYDSNCNYFSQANINNFTCNDQSFTPTAFKEETLNLEIKKLFGERTNIQLTNIQLGQTCIGGYEYIAERGEFVEGECSKAGSTEFSVNKSLIKAISKDNTIILTEEVKYVTNESVSLPDYLKSGYYIYTFKLDTNYNYAYISKEYKSKY